MNGGVDWTNRLFKAEAGAMLVRNTVVSTGTFLTGLGIMWLLVEWLHVDKRAAAAISFAAATSIHYVFGRTWIFRGTERPVASGYLYFFINAGVGLVLTVLLFDLFLALIPAHYIVSRIVASVFAGLAMFLLNAMLNFRRL